MSSLEKDKSYWGNSSQFFVAGELCRRGYAAFFTLGNTPNTDVLWSNRDGIKFVHIQVKTFVPGSKTCSGGKKAERMYGSNFFWVIGGIPTPCSELPFRYCIVPSNEMASNVAARHHDWLSALGKKGQQRKGSSIRAVAVEEGAASYFWNVEEYEERWDLIENALRN